jgi:hypothetical protein
MIFSTISEEATLGRDAATEEDGAVAPAAAKEDGPTAEEAAAAATVASVVVEVLSFLGRGTPVNPSHLRLIPCVFLYRAGALISRSKD